MNYTTIWPQFFTASIYKRKFLLKDDAYKDIIIECLQFLVAHNRIELSAFTIMSNHVHLIWQPLGTFSLAQIQTSFMTYTSKRIKNKLSLENQPLLEQVRVNKFDRTYQIWKREPLSIELFTENVFLQKLEYIHGNPVSAGLVNYGDMYKYSSAKFYADGFDEFEILTHYIGN